MAVNPVSILADASRGLMHGNADGRDILIVIATAARDHRDLRAADDASLPHPQLTAPAAARKRGCPTHDQRLS